MEFKCWLLKNCSVRTGKGNGLWPWLVWKPSILNFLQEVVMQSWNCWECPSLLNIGHFLSLTKWTSLDSLLTRLGSPLQKGEMWHFPAGRPTHPRLGPASLDGDLIWAPGRRTEVGPAVKVVLLLLLKEIQARPLVLPSSREGLATS